MSADPLPIEERTFWRRVSRRTEGLTRRATRARDRLVSEPLGVGLLGVGNVARWLYLPRLRNPRSQFRLAAVYDVDQAAARKVADAFGAHTCASLTDLTRRDDLAAVLVCTPVRFHCESVLAAFAERKHVLCEKPLGYTLAESRTMWSAAQTSGCVHMVNFSYRFRPELVYVTRLIRAGILGRVCHASGTVSQGQWFTETGLPSQERGDAASWKFGPDGGVLLDLGPHLIDFCRSCFGEIKECQAWTKSLRTDEARCEDVCGVSLTFEKDTMAQLLTSRWATGHKERTWLEVSGSKGGLELEQGVVRLWLRSAPRWRTLMIPPLDGGDFLDRFRAAIAGQTVTIPDFHDGLKNNEAIEAVFRSAKSRCAMSLPLDDPGTTGAEAKTRSQQMAETVDASVRAPSS